MVGRVHRQRGQLRWKVHIVTHVDSCFLQMFGWEAIICCVSEANGLFGGRYGRGGVSKQLEKAETALQVSSLEVTYAK